MFFCKFSHQVNVSKADSSLTTPNLHPNDEDLSLGTPVMKTLGSRALRMTVLVGMRSESHRSSPV